MASNPEHPPEALLEEDPVELYEHAPSGYLTALEDGMIVRVNETCCEWVGYPKAELIGTRWQDLLTVPGRVYFETHIRPLLRMHGEAKGIAVDLRCRDTGTLPVLINCIARAVDAGPKVY